MFLADRFSFFSFFSFIILTITSFALQIDPSCDNFAAQGDAKPHLENAFTLTKKMATYAFFLLHDYISEPDQVNPSDTYRIERLMTAFFLTPYKNPPKQRRWPRAPPVCLIGRPHYHFALLKTTRIILDS